MARGEHYLPTSIQSRFSEFSTRLLERLLSTNKIVEFERSPVKKAQAEQMDTLLQGARSCWKGKQVQKALGLLRRFEHEFASQIQQRDISYAQRLEILVAQHADKRILCIRGLLHLEPLQRALEQRRVVFDSYQFKESYDYTIAESVTLAFLHGDKVVDDTLVRLHIEQDYSNREIAAGNFNYQTRMAIKDKVLAMTQDDIENYIASM